MIPFSFIVKVVVVTSSGALSPGPLTASVLKVGNREGARVGFLASVGHTIVEFPLVILIALGIAYVLENPLAVFLIGVIGGAFIIFLGVLTILDARKGFNPEQSGGIFRRVESPLFIGLFLSLFNPFFIIWWIGVGAPIAVEAIQLAGFIGIGIMYVSHVWLDYVWLTSVAYFSYKGTQFLSSRGYKILMGLIGILLIYFGIQTVLGVTRFL